jgi:hypothetical protein
LRDKIGIPQLIAKTGKAATKGRLSSRQTSDNSGYISLQERIFRAEGSIQIAAPVTAMAAIAVIAKSVVHMASLLVF